ncbi:MAG: hypothetical protein WB988_04420 [Candidatus Nitrosopolaris sp.]
MKDYILKLLLVSPYQAGKRYCRRCEVYFYQVERFCRCCGMTLRTSPAGKNTKRNVKLQLSGGMIAAYNSSNYLGE